MIYSDNSINNESPERWRRMFIVEKNRLLEVVTLYKSLGYEVMIKKPSLNKFDKECENCSKKICEECWEIYVKKINKGKNINDDLI